MTESERRHIDGKDESWEVSRDGKIYRYGCEWPITHDIAGLPTVDLGEDYEGRVPRAGGTTKRLVEEIVAAAFLELPDDDWDDWDWDACRFLHKDGNDQNAAADNLHPFISDEEIERRKLNKMRRYMRPDFLPNKVNWAPSDSGSRRMDKGYAIFTESTEIPGHIPTGPITYKKVS